MACRKGEQEANQYKYEAGLRAKGSRCMVYADIVKGKQQEENVEIIEEAAGI